MQDLIIRPYLTEKSLKSTKTGRYTFLVNLDANKHQIKELIEKLYKVNVTKVTIQRTQRQVHRSGRTGRYTIEQPIKKALVQLKDKQTLPIFKTN